MSVGNGIERLTAALASRYTIGHELGAGVPGWCGKPGLRHPWARLTRQPRSFERLWARASQLLQCMLIHSFFDSSEIIRRFRS